MSAGQGDPLHQGFPRQPHQDKEEGVPRKKARLPWLSLTGTVPGQKRTGKEVQRYLLPGRVRKEHCPGRGPTGQVYEGQAAEYGGTRFRHPYPVYGAQEDKYHRIETGQQGDAPLGNRVQPEKIPEIRPKTFHPDSYGERGGKACPAIIRKNYGPLREKPFSGARKIHVQLLA